jgi:hypothetical protein
VSKNAKRRLKEIQAMHRLAHQLKEGVYLGDDLIQAHLLVDTSWLEEADVQEILGDMYDQTEDSADAHALLQTAARKAMEMGPTLEKVADALDEDVLDEDYPMELVEQELREAGLDPERIARTGRRIAARFASKGRIKGGTMKVRAHDILAQAVEDGVVVGWRRAHKHTEKPSPDSVIEQIEREVMNAICEHFDFE